MYPARLVLFTLLAVTVLTAQSNDTHSLDGLDILRQLSDHYAKAVDWYVAATEEQTSQSEYSRQWSKT